MKGKKAKSESPIGESEATSNEAEATESPSPSSNEAEIQAEKQSPRDLAQKLLLAGASTSEITEKTGLSALQVEGMRGQIIKHVKKVEKTDARDRLDSSEPYVTKSDALKSILLDLGLKRPEMIVTLTDAYGYDLESVYWACRDSNIGASQLKYIILRWAAEEKLNVPSWMQRQLDQPSRPLSARPGGPGSEPGGFEDQPHYLTETRLREVLEEERRKTTEESRLSKIESKIEEVLQRNNGSGNSQVQDLKNEVKELKNSLIDARLSGMQHDIEKLEKEAVSADGLAQMFKSAENLGNKLLERAPLQTFFLPLSEAPLRSGSPEASNRTEIIDQLEKRGLVTRVVRK